MWGLISRAAAPPSCADKVYLAGDEDNLPIKFLGVDRDRLDERVRESYERIMPFSSDTY